jgi:predicted nucleic acid-binding protein
LQPGLLAPAAAVGVFSQASDDCPVPGDSDLLVLKKFEGVDIVAPRQFMKSIAAE